MYSDAAAFEDYVAECEDFSKYRLRLLCLSHGLYAVTSAKALGEIRNEGGSLNRHDFLYTLTCGCQRRKDLFDGKVAVAA